MVAWAEKCTLKSIKNSGISNEDVFNTYLDVQSYMRFNQYEAAKQALAMLQKRIDKLQVSLLFKNKLV